MNDLISLGESIFFWFTPDSLYFAIAFFLFHYISQIADKNFTTFKKLIRNIINFKYIFRIFKLSLIINIIFLFLNHKNYTINNYIDYKFSNILVDALFHNLLKILVLLFILSSLVYAIFKPQIIEYIEDSHWYHKNRWSRTKYNIFCFLSYSTIVIIFFVSFKLIQYIDLILINNHIYPYFEPKNNLPFTEVVYKRGVYFSIALSFLFFLFLINALFKRIRSYYTFYENIENIFALIILSFALYSGFYSILNYWINYNFIGLSDEWVKNDKLIGHFSVRFTSIIVMWSILRFTFKKIFENDFLSLVNSIAPIKTSNKIRYTINYRSYYDIYYFNQVGFYVLNIFVAEYLISSSHVDFNATILFGLLPIIVDDFFAIHVYVKTGISMDWWHKIKLHLFNLHF